MADWPVMKIKSGPHGKDTTVEIDGKPVERTTRVEIVADVHDATRVLIHQFLIVDAEIEGAHVGYPTRVVVRDPNLGIVVESKADTLWQALYDCGRQLELAAQGVAQGGTIGESSGRPPGH